MSSSYTTFRSGLSSPVTITIQRRNRDGLPLGSDLPRPVGQPPRRSDPTGSNLPESARLPIRTALVMSSMESEKKGAADAIGSDTVSQNNRNVEGVESVAAKHFPAPFLIPETGSNEHAGREMGQSRAASTICANSTDTMSETGPADSLSSTSAHQRSLSLQESLSKKIYPRRTKSALELSPPRSHHWDLDSINDEVDHFELAPEDMRTAAWVAEAYPYHHTRREDGSVEVILRRASQETLWSGGHSARRLVETPVHNSADDSVPELDFQSRSSERDLSRERTSAMGGVVDRNPILDEVEQSSERDAVQHRDMSPGQERERYILELEVANNALRAEVDSLREDEDIARIVEQRRAEWNSTMKTTESESETLRWIPVRGNASTPVEESGAFLYEDMPSRVVELRIKARLLNAQLYLMMPSEKNIGLAEENADFASQLARDELNDQTLAGKCSYWRGMAEFEAHNFDDATKSFERAQLHCKWHPEGLLATEKLKMLELRANQDPSPLTPTTPPSATSQYSNTFSDSGTLQQTKPMNLAMELEHAERQSPDGSPSGTEQSPSPGTKQSPSPGTHQSPSPGTEQSPSPRTKTALPARRQRKGPPALMIPTRTALPSIEDETESPQCIVSASTAALHAPIPQRKSTLPQQNLSPPNSPQPIPKPAANLLSPSSSPPSAKSKLAISVTAVEPTKKVQIDDTSPPSSRKTSPTHPFHRRRRSKIYDEEAQQDPDDELGEESGSAPSSGSSRERMPSLGDAEAQTTPRTPAWRTWFGME